MSGERKKCCYIGAPKVFALESACRLINAAFGDFGCYLVGSALERADWRDVDIRFIMPDEDFKKVFPEAWVIGALWEHDARWLLINTAIAEHLSRLTQLPIDFQIQPQTFANEKHPGQRSAIGLQVVARPKAEAEGRQAEP